MRSEADKIEAFLAGATEAIERAEKEISQLVYEFNDSGHDPKYVRKVLESLENVVESNALLGSAAGSREGVIARRAIARTLIWLIKNEL